MASNTQNENPDYYHVYATPEYDPAILVGFVAETTRPLTYTQALNLARNLRAEGRVALVISRSEMAKVLVAVP